MTHHQSFLFGLVLLLPLTVRAQQAPHFRMQEIDHSLKVGYGVLIEDLNGDGKPDIIVADSERVIWFENPTWQMHVILQGQTIPDNVCLAPIDLDGDGKLDLVLGAGWKGYNTKEQGTVQWLGRGKDVNQPWTLHPIGKEVDIHRIHVVDVHGKGKPSIFVAPLLGAGATQKSNWSDVAPRFLEFDVPADPIGGAWTPKLVQNQLHVMHNFTPVNWNGQKQVSLLAASYEGITLLTPGNDGSWQMQHIADGDQSNPNGSRGTSEVKVGKGPGGKPFIATVEPWHGNQLVVYTAPKNGQGPWERHVQDDQMKEGHGVWCADLDGDGVDDIVVGSRNAFNATTGPGVNWFKSTSADASKWEKHVIDNKGVAAEDLAVGDLNGDGRPDVVAVGRATHNVRIYWNEGR
jgi:aldos-2-ulose dehydratase/isomerase family protein/VCBS repeat protein/FG-GAP repeat protein